MRENGNLVLKRKESNWTNVRCRTTGQTFRIRTQKIENGVVHLVFEDKGNNFEFERPERNKLGGCER